MFSFPSAWLFLGGAGGGGDMGGREVMGREKQAESELGMAG